MKIVINRCFGGYSLSPAAVRMLAERQGRDCFIFEDTYKSGMHRYKLAAKDPKGFFTAFDVADIPHPATNKWYTAHNLDRRPDLRTDPDLIHVVETLGTAANGPCAELRVVEIPDDVDYEIDEYDGNETIHERHRSW